MLIEKVMEGLEKEANEHARQAMLKSLDGVDVVLRTGENRGFYKGLIHAAEVIKKIVAEEKARERIEEPTEFD